ncbi:peptide-N(4)-(N-acetyl-beta-glucosaminyl)asparagine amidase [Adelges cooleyi]|uniref:peptide-N(4)-(N-acetyl-beta- glucosaminyl)asparagine amidase n=1 Tax=Adelges cooleyi TaxID=133065 RepID=UPI00217FDAEF|nr:peptide-N(4)-(N-acetyl-beta-glucosaminyl)asparagine amidase [Adelges cooleyi]
MLQSIDDLKSNKPDICFQVTKLLIKIVDTIIKNPYQPKFRRVYLDSDVVQNGLLPFAGAMEFLLEIGFIDDDNSLVLPACIDQITLNSYKQELLKIMPVDKNSILAIDNSFLKDINSTSLAVLTCEDKLLQKMALEYLTPEQVLKYSVINTSPTELYYHEKMMLELMKWFKESFFKWFDTPQCLSCNISMKFKGINHNVPESNVRYAEMYECENCYTISDFKRYSLCEQLLITRIGRCGEWANSFTLFCRALGWEARYVVDQTDHVWTEVWTEEQKRWIHCDPCETAIDKPLLYEKGWGKKLSYVLAYSNEEVQDVTWRYTAKKNDVMLRRTLCKENDLLETILLLSKQRQIDCTISRRKYLAERRLKECVELLFQPNNTVADNYDGRISGSLDWKLTRRETKIHQYVWTPTKAEIDKKQFELKYSTAVDKYIHDGITLEGWQNGVYNYCSIFRKEELDWKMVYLCRKENSMSAKIEWKFDFTTTGLLIRDITLIYSTSLFNNGKVEWKLNGKNCSEDLPVIESLDGVVINKFIGSSSIILSASLFGGSGELAWQHTQLFRQSSSSQEYAFQIIFSLE